MTDAEFNRSKDIARGISGDMSPEAISKRFQILIELNDLCKTLSSARPLGKVADPSGSDSKEAN